MQTGNFCLSVTVHVTFMNTFLIIQQTGDLYINPSNAEATFVQSTGMHFF